MSLATRTASPRRCRYPLPALPENWSPELAADIFSPPSAEDLTFQNVSRDLLRAVFSRVKRDGPVRTHADLAARALKYVEGERFYEVVAQERPGVAGVLLSERIAATFRSQLFSALSGY